MFEYRRCIGGSFLEIKSSDAEDFLKGVLVDVSNYAFELLPWDVGGAYDSLPDDWDGFFRGVKRLRRELKRLGLSAEEVKFAVPVIVMRKVVDLVPLRDLPSPGGCEGEFIHFVFIDGKRKAVKRFSFGDGSSVFDRFRAFVSIQGSVVTKLCGDLKRVKKEGRTVDSFKGGEVGVCDVVVALKRAGVNPVVDVKKLDKYLGSL